MAPFNLNAVEIVKNIFKDSLYGNTLWLIASSLVLTGFGFFFWTINTRLFTSEQVGIASTLLASVELIVALSLLGFDVAIIRYIPKFKDSRKIVNSCFSLAGIVALIISAIFIIKIDIFLPKITVLNNYLLGILFIIFVIFTLFSKLTAAVLIAIKKSKVILIYSSVFSVLKLIFPFLLVSLGAYGIFSSWMAALAVSLSIIFFFNNIRVKFEINKEIIKNMFEFSFVNYFSNFLGMAPGIIFPIMITNLINPRSTAYFYMAWMFSALLLAIPVSISKSLLAEGSTTKNNLKKNVRKSIKITFLLLIPTVIAVVFLAKYLLLMFGQEYSENAYRLLQLLALASLPFSINIIYITVKNVQHKIKAVLLVFFLMAAGSLGLSFIFLSYGIIVIGLSWLITQTLVAIFTSIMVFEYV